MKLIGLDMETTGLEYEKGHRICEIALLTYDFESQRLEERYVQRIDPERSIDPGASAAHGITYADLVGQPKWQDVAQGIADRLEQGSVLIAHNMDFDGPFLSAELRRIGLSMPHIAQFCTMKNARWATPDGKAPKLGELCFALGVDYDPAKAHGADYDTTVMMDCYFRALLRGFFQLPQEVNSPLKQAA